MRRILRKIAAGEEDSIGDVSTLADPAVSSFFLFFLSLLCMCVVYLRDNFCYRWNNTTKLCFLFLCFTDWFLLSDLIYIAAFYYTQVVTQLIAKFKALHAK